MRARAADEFVFTLDVCAADERTCSSGTYDDFTVSVSFFGSRIES